MFDRFEKFTILINKVARYIHKIKSDEMLKYGLKSTHVTCVYYLFRDGSLTAKQLCDICDEDKAAISRAVEHLENIGYVVCQSKTEKRYKSPIALTAKGCELGEAIANRVDDVLNKASAGLGETERKIFYKGLTLICDNLQKLCEEEK